MAQMAVTVFGADFGAHHAKRGIAVFGQDGQLKLCNPNYTKIWNLNPDFVKTTPHISEIVAETEHFFKSFCDTSACTLNINIQGKNAHHMIEATFKGFARAIKAAIAYTENREEMPSTKGIL